MKAQVIEPITQTPQAVKGRPSRLERALQDSNRERILKAFAARPGPKRPRKPLKNHREDRLERRHKRLFPKRLRSSIDLEFLTRGFKRRFRFESLLDATMPEFMDYIESRFASGMNWAEREKWTLGHIVPLHLAQTSAELRALYHHANLKPVWMRDRAKEGAYPLTLPGYITPEIRAIWQRAQEI